MANKKRKGFVPDSGLPCQDGIPTITVGPGQERTVQYLSPRKNKPKSARTTARPSQPPLPSLLDSQFQTRMPGEFVHDLEASVQPPLEEVQKTKVNNTIPPHVTTNNFLTFWAQRLLNIFRAHETDPDLEKPCQLCGDPQASATYRCFDCVQPPLLCKTCITTSHTNSPFHRIQSWTGKYFQRCSLAELGLIFHLGHRGAPCPTPADKATASNITVVHTTGVQDICVRYCQCRAPSSAFPLDQPLQLWTAGLWPATYARTQTVFTIHALRQFHDLNMQAKVSAYDYYEALKRQTNHAFAKDVKNRYREFMTAHRHFSYVRSLKRFAIDVAKKLKAGCLAVLCPACPQPDINMDPAWQSRPQAEWYKDAFQYAKDGNFNLSQHDKKIDLEDISLTNGAAYYVDNDEFSSYMEIMKQYSDTQEETTTCSNFDALSDKYAGKRKSGQVSMCCARHEMVLARGTVDLDKGERYVHVDFVTTQALSPWMRLKLFISSYDVNCRYGINWLSRLKRIPGVSRVWPLILRCVPKFHLPAHKGPCRWLNSFYYMPWVGMTDGEAPERRWAILNALGRSVREMGSGHRQDVLNEHNSDYNIQKVFGIAKRLQKKYTEALRFSAQNISELGELEETLRANSMPLDQWKTEEARFLHQVINPDARTIVKKSPYEPLEDNAPSLKTVLAELNQGDADRRVKNSKRKTSGTDDEQLNVQTYYHENSGIGALLMSAIDIDRQQTHVRALVTEYHTTEEPRTFNTIEDMRRKLEQKIEQWYACYHNVMGPALALLREELPLPDFSTRPSCQPEEEELPIPSALPDAARSHSLLSVFVQAERRLRQGQANDSLREIRNKIGLYSFLWKKMAGSYGQATKTRNAQSTQGTRDKIKDLRLQYEATRKKLLALGEPIDSHNYQPLTDHDCRPMELGHAQEKPGRKTKTIAWIWRDGAYHEDMNKWQVEATRLEWFRASARTTRWQEELGIVEEEIKRTQRFFEHFRRVWDERSQVSSDHDDPVERGAAAFAARQAGMYARLLDNARTLFPEALHIKLRL